MGLGESCHCCREQGRTAKAISFGRWRSRRGVIAENIRPLCKSCLDAGGGSSWWYVETDSEGNLLSEAPKEEIRHDSFGYPLELFPQEVGEALFSGQTVEAQLPPPTPVRYTVTLKYPEMEEKKPDYSCGIKKLRKSLPRAKQIWLSKEKTCLFAVNEHLGDEKATLTRYMLATGSLAIDTLVSMPRALSTIGESILLWEYPDLYEGYGPDKEEPEKKPKGPVCIYSTPMTVKGIEEHIYDRQQLEEAREKIQKKVQRTLPSWPSCHYAGAPVTLKFRDSRQSSGMIVVTGYWLCEHCSKK